jgi:hypothetical protein
VALLTEIAHLIRSFWVAAEGTALHHRYILEELGMADEAILAIDEAIQPDPIISWPGKRRPLMLCPWEVQ